MPAIQQEVKSVSHKKLESFLDRVRSPVGTLDTPLVLDILCLLDQSYRTHHLQSLFQRCLPFYKPQRLPSNPLRQSAHQYKCNQNDIYQLNHPEPQPTSALTIEEAAKKVIAGEFGNGDQRRKAIEALGLSYDAVQKRVNELVSSSAPKQTKVYYSVVSGDTLSGIAAKHGLTLAALLKLNPSIKNPNIIYPGQKIRVK